MVAYPKAHYITPEEYLMGEDEAETKSEYVNGVIIAMSGASPEHAAITFNFIAAIQTHLRTAGCRGFSSDLRVRIEAANTYYYPDFTVVCGEPQFEIRHGLRQLLNPSLIVEVLSSTTEKRDRGEKWLAYWGIESLTTYILAHQERPTLEIYTRAPGADAWVVTRVEGLDKMLDLTQFGCTVPLADIYEDVAFTVADVVEAE